MPSLKKDLILITNHFPYKNGEVFLANEFPYLSESFGKIVIISRTDQKQIDRTIGENVSLLKLSPKSTFQRKLVLLIIVLKKIRTLQQLIRKERNNLAALYKRKLTFSLFSLIIHDAIKALEIQNFIEKRALPLVDSDCILYSYWQDNAALALALIKTNKKDVITICRSHRTDLYFYANKLGYLTHRQFISENIDKLFFISKDGLEYQAKLLQYKYKTFFLSLLGTKRIEIVDQNKNVGQKVIASCSTLTNVKRVHLIIKALALINDLNVEWIHFGSGELEEEIHKLALDKLSDKKNIKYVFKGQQDNQSIHRYYANNCIDMFINVSESEGIPVSIMEALSYGIPVLATNVGGTSEIVDNNCGLLIDKDVDISSLSQSILSELTSENTSLKRVRAVEKWEHEYNGEKNYKKFINEIYQ